MSYIDALEARYDSPLAVFKAKLPGVETRAEGDEIRVIGFGGLLVNPDKGVWRQHSGDQGGGVVAALAFVIHGDSRRTRGADLHAICKAEGVSPMSHTDRAPASPPPERKPDTPAAAPPRRLWSDAGEAAENFASLDPVSLVPDALAILSARYPSLHAFPDEWRVLPAGEFKIDGKPAPMGVVYPGRSPDGAPAFKWKGLAARPAKRESRILHGDPECFFRFDSPDPLAPLVVVAGEEKALAAWNAGFSVVCPLMGEKASENIARKIVASRPPSIILANDHDPAGAKSNADFAAHLVKFGMPEHAVSVVQWPPEFPAGADLTDVRPDTLPSFLASALPLPASRALAAAAPYPLLDLDTLFALEIDPRDTLLGEGDDVFLSRGGALVLAGQPGLGKSRLASQLVFDFLLGRKAFLGTIPINRDDLRILVLQDENSVRRLRQDFSAHLRGVSPDSRAAAQARLLFSDPRSLPDFNLGDDAAVAALRSTVAVARPDLILVDPWSSFFDCDGSENDAADTNRSLRVLNTVARTAGPHVATILVHHSRTGREAAAGGTGWDAGGFVRGSKALAGKARTVLNLLPGGEKFPTHLVVACGKTNDARPFAPFGIKNEEGRFLPDPEFDFEEWCSDARNPKRDKVSAPSKVPESVVLEILDSAPLRFNALVRAIVERTSCSQTTAKTQISELRKAGKISEISGMLMARRDPG